MGSGGTNKAQKQAAAADQQKEDDITKSVAGVNAIYDSPDRQKQYTDLAADTTKYYTGDVNRQEAVQARSLKFAQARSGLSGGSQSAYQDKVLGQDYSKAIIDATRKGNEAGANLQNADESSRMSLIGMAESGLDAGTAANQATSSLQNNFLTAESGATADQLGSAFTDLNGIYQSSQDAKTFRDTQKYGLGGLFGNPVYGNSGGQPSGGTFG